MARMTKVTKSALLTDPKTIELLASPLRQELVDALEARGGEASVAELAQDLGRRPDALYYHLRLLERGALVSATEGRSAAGRDERRYRLERPRGARYMLRYRPEGAAKPQRHRAAVEKAIGGMLRIAGKDFAHALADPEAATEGATREVWASRQRGWVTRAELTEINRLLGRLNDIVQGPPSAGADRLLSFCFVLAKLPQDD